MPPPFRHPGKAARNERRKAFATMLNAVSIAALVPALFQPLGTGRLNLPVAAASLAWFVVLQSVLHMF